MKDEEQSEPQLIPEGDEDTVPLPLLLTLKVKGELNVAVTVLSESIVTVQEPVPEHPPPDHPSKVEPDAAVAVRVTVVSVVTDAVQVEPQSMPEGVEVTVPLPVPLLLMLKVCEAEGVDDVWVDAGPSP